KRRASAAGLPPPASQFGQSRYGDRFLYKPVSDHVESGLERNSRSQVSQQRAGAVQQDRGAAAGEAAKRDLTFLLAWHRRAQKSRALQKSARGQTTAALYRRPRRLRARQQRHVARQRRRAWADQGADRGGQGKAR